MVVHSINKVVHSIDMVLHAINILFRPCLWSANALLVIYSERRFMYQIIRSYSSWWIFNLCMPSLCKSVISKTFTAFAFTKLPPLKIVSPWPLRSFCRIFIVINIESLENISLKYSDVKFKFSLFWMGHYEESTLRKIY